MQAKPIPCTRLYQVLRAGEIRNAPEVPNPKEEGRLELLELTAKLASAKRELELCHSGWVDIERTIAKLLSQVEEYKKKPKYGRFRISNGQIVSLVPK